MDARLNTAFQSAVDAKKVPGVGGIVLDKSGKILWSGAFGKVNALDNSAADFTLDTPCLIFSCTKLVTTIMALQLMEEGKLSLDDPVEKHDPDFANIKVLDGFDADGKPKLREPKSKATMLHLMTHTSGLAYDFFDHNMLKYRIAMGQQPSQTMAAGIKDTYAGPLMFDPGREYCYGMNTDWIGFVIEKIEGKKLFEVLQERIIKPLGLNNTSNKFDESKPRMILHFRTPDGLAPVADLKPLENPAVNGGGEFMICTLNDYSQILLPLLNGGKHPVSGVQILKEETVKKHLFSDNISSICGSENVGMIPQAVAQLTNTGEMMPGVKRSWSTALLLNEENSPHGRKAGSGAWAGLANSYYWVDPSAGKLGFFTTSIVPFFDRESLHLFDEMERAAYGVDAKKQFDETGGNYGDWDAAPKAAL